MRASVCMLMALALLAGACAGGSSTSRDTGIDQVPMYGGIDRQAVPELKRADEEFIAAMTREFGSREKASEQAVGQGIRYYMVDDYAAAMRRFNQAWLLNPDNPDAFWGFAMVLHDQGRNCEGKDMVDRALALGLAGPIALADAARIYTLCGLSQDAATKEQHFQVSEELYERAIAASPTNDYIYGSWATACYWRGDYARSWEMVRLARAQGFVFTGPFLDLLRQAMPEPP